MRGSKLANLKTAVRRLHGLGLEPWLEAGTLLGYVRENDLIEWDTDIDLGLPSENVSKKNDIIDALKKEGFDLYMEFGYDENGLELSFKRQTKLDIFFTYPEDGQWTQSCWDKGDQLKHYFDCLGEFESVTFLGCTVLVPKNAVRYCEQRYGQDWRSPDPDYTWLDAKNIKRISGESIMQATSPKDHQTLPKMS